MIRHHALMLFVGLTLVTGLYVAYAMVDQLAPTLLGNDLFTRLPTIRLDVANR